MLSIFNLEVLKMALLLGSGEYEKIDNNIRQSTLKVRHIFLQKLGDKRSQCFFDLLRLFNSNIAPVEFWNEQNRQNVFSLSILALSKKLPADIKMLPELIDTPLFHYYTFLFEKESLIKELEKDEELQNFVTSFDPKERKKNAIKKIIPNWKVLKSIPEAKMLCQSLENWADKYHLNEEWILDFVLQILCFFKLNFENSLFNYFQSENQSYFFYSIKTDYEIDVATSVGKANFDYDWEEMMRMDWVTIFENSEDFPSFIYRWRDFELPSTTWVVTIETRQHFCKKMREVFNDSIANLKDSKRHWHYTNEKELNVLLERCKKQLVNYCDKIEERLVNSGDEYFIQFTPIYFNNIGKANWYPSKQTRDEFIDEVLPELKILIANNKKALQSLATLTKRHFEIKLKEYCNEMEHNLPANYVRTPQKYAGEKHFEWLIDYQVTPNKSFREIAEVNKTDKKTISEPVKELAEILGLSLRKSKQGRPSGTKDSPKSNRQLRILQS